MISRKSWLQFMTRLALKAKKHQTFQRKIQQYPKRQQKVLLETSQEPKIRHEELAVKERELSLEPSANRARNRRIEARAA